MVAKAFDPRMLVVLRYPTELPVFICFPSVVDKSILADRIGLEPIL